jgi:hypothetical protein
LAHTLANPCLGHEPKAKVVTLTLSPSFQFIITTWKGKVFLVKKSFKNMWMAISKFLPIDFATWIS